MRRHADAAALVRRRTYATSPVCRRYGAAAVHQRADAASPVRRQPYPQEPGTSRSSYVPTNRDERTEKVMIRLTDDVVTLNYYWGAKIRKLLWRKLIQEEQLLNGGPNKEF
jgi:hypothetical protein